MRDDDCFIPKPNQEKSLKLVLTVHVYFQPSLFDQRGPKRGPKLSLNPVYSRIWRRALPISKSRPKLWVPDQKRKEEFDEKTSLRRSHFWNWQVGTRKATQISNWPDKTGWCWKGCLLSRQNLQKVSKISENRKVAQDSNQSRYINRTVEIVIPDLYGNSNSVQQQCGHWCCGGFGWVPFGAEHIKN